MLDAVSVALWDSLRLAGAEPGRLARFGQVFATPV